MELKYEQAVKRLEEIVAKLEGGSLSLDESLKLYEEGAKLLYYCRKTLESAKQRIIDINEVKNDD